MFLLLLRFSNETLAKEVFGRLAVAELAALFGELLYQKVVEERTSCREKRSRCAEFVVQERALREVVRDLAAPSGSRVYPAGLVSLILNEIQSLD